MITLHFHVKVLTDNCTAMADINHNFTSSCLNRNALAKEIWLWCSSHNIWLTAAHIPGVSNVEADRQSRMSQSQLEWTLNPTIFQESIHRLGVNPTIYLFASRINFQLQPYVSYHPDPGAVAINAFHMSWKCHLFYAFPPFCLISRVLQKIKQEKSTVAHTGLVARVDENVSQQSNPSTEIQEHTVPSQLFRDSAPSLSQAGTHPLPLVGRLLACQGLSKEASEIIGKSWRSGTAKQYRTYLQKWDLFCNRRNIDPLNPPIQEGINFLAELFATGIGYSCLNTARSALSSIITLPGGQSFGHHSLVTGFLKGVFELRPALPRYKEIWDVSPVLNMLESWKLGSTLTLKDLTLKVTMLLALLSGQRLQTLKAFSVKSMTLTDTKCVFQINVPLKTTRPGRHMSTLEFCEYTPSDDLCIVKHLKFYVNSTSTLRRDCDQLLITYNKPHRAASSETIGRWLKTVMTKSGIDTQQFGAPEQLLLLQLLVKKYQ